MFLAMPSNGVKFRNTGFQKAEENAKRKISEILVETLWKPCGNQIPGGMAAEGLVTLALALTTFGS